MILTKPFDIREDAKDTQKEVEDDIAAFLSDLAKKHDGDSFKAVITANMMLAVGIDLMTKFGMSPNDIMVAIGDMVKTMSDDPEARSIIIPGDLADDVKKPEGKPS